MRYSSSLEEVVIDGFTYNGKYYSWHDDDCVYYDDDTDEEYYMEVPDDAIPD